ncbi:MAG: hypothetical protein HY343_03135 [Lentisphaerae bacterium]|nr:hypothetical protein [Lentisphaerota bacterium]
MKPARKTGMNRFTVKGHVVIPRLKPLTAKRYDKLQGCLKGAGVLEALMEDRKKEREL